jgi:hypothetical protein
VAIAGKWCQVEARQRTGCRSVVPWPGQALGVRAIRGCRWRGPCWQRSITGSSVGPSSSRSVKPATKRRRRQCRAVPGGDRRQVGQVEGETAYRLPIGVAVAWSGSRGAGNPRLPLAWPVLAALDHRQFGRAFVLSIGEAGHEATTAPVSSGAGWRSPASGPGRRRDSAPAADRGCRGLGRLSGCLQASVADVRQGCRRRGPCWQRSTPAVRSGFVLSIGEAGHEATTAPASSGAGWRSPASGPGRRRDSAPAADRGCRGLGLGVLAGNPRLPLAWPVLAALDHRQFGRAFVLSIGEAGHEATTAPVSSGAWWRSPASGPGRRRDSAPAADRGCRGVGRVAISGCWQCSITGSSVGPSSSRSVKPATKRRRRQCRAVPGGDRRQVVPGRRRDSAPAADRSCRGLVRLSGCGQSAVAAGVARAGSARPPAVRSGLRSLDR